MKPTIKIPQTPNFVQLVLSGAQVSVSIADVSDEDLENLGEEWTAALLESARKKRVPR
jgi:hypothetical protein